MQRGHRDDGLDVLRERSKAQRNVARYCTIGDESFVSDKPTFSNDSLDRSKDRGSHRRKFNEFNGLPDWTRRIHAPAVILAHRLVAGVGGIVQYRYEN